jgi:hypothetical protein
MGLNNARWLSVHEVHVRPESWQVFAMGESKRNLVTHLYGVPHSTGA